MLVSTRLEVEINTIEPNDIIKRGVLSKDSAVLYHVMPNMPRYKVGERICQIKLGVTAPLDFEVVEELNETARGSGAYGSTGK